MAVADKGSTGTVVQVIGPVVDVSFEGKQAPSGPQPYDMLLLSVGRSPNGRKIDAEKAGVSVTERSRFTSYTLRGDPGLVSLCRQTAPLRDRVSTVNRAADAIWSKGAVGGGRIL